MEHVGFYKCILYIVYIYIIRCVCPLNMGKETDTQQAEQPYLSRLSKLRAAQTFALTARYKTGRSVNTFPVSPLQPHLSMYITFWGMADKRAWLWRALLFALAAAGESFINKKTVWLCCLASCKGCTACLAPHHLPTCLAVQPFEATLEWRCHGICWWRIFDLPYELKQHLNCIQSAISFAALAGCKSQQGDGGERIRGRGRGRGIPRQ